MERARLRCQICHVSFNKMWMFKSHVQLHREKLQEIFPHDTFTASNSYFPFLSLLGRDKSKIVGLTHLTLVFGGEADSCFYLCHVCHLKCPHELILNHVFCGDHFTNFLSITSPSSLEFSWVPKMEQNGSHLCLEDKRNKVFQMLHLPVTLLSKLESSHYSDVMHTLCQNEKLYKVLKDTLPESDLIQNYQKDSQRKNPLLGLHHIVECVCVGLSNLRHYLCTLCQITVSAHMIIKHVLSFDHIHRYFAEWHPSTLSSKASYLNIGSLSDMLLDLAEQAEEIQGRTHMNHISLEPAEFQSVNFKSYSEALMKLESMKNCSLQISIKPGKKLVKQSTLQVPSRKFFSSLFQIRCQVCSACCSNMFLFIKHLSQSHHHMASVRVFQLGAKVNCSPAIGKFNLGLYSDIQKLLRKNKPLIGIPMIVSCITTEAEIESLYLCFACMDYIQDSFIEEHISSEKHLMLTLYQYQDPEVLPFAWESSAILDMVSLKDKLWEKEKAAGSFISMKVVDLPYRIFCSIAEKSYSEVVQDLDRFSSSLTDGVPLLERNRGLKAKNNFPLLGEHFLVKYDALTTDSQKCTALLCLLCERKLDTAESYFHIFSLEHVTTFLEKFHPGSLNASNVNTKVLLNLAQQAETLHDTKIIQVVQLPLAVPAYSSYQKTIDLLKSSRMGMFEPTITPKGKLVYSSAFTGSPAGDEGTRRDPTVCVKEEQDEKNKGGTDMSEQKPSLKKEFSEPVTEAVKTSSEESQVTKREESERGVEETSEKVPESSPNTVKDVEMQIKKEDENNENVPGRCELYGDKRRVSDVSGGSQEDTCLNTQQFMSEGESSLENGSTDTLEKSHKSQQDNGLGSLYDCRCDKRDSVHHSECCPLKISQEEYIDRVSGPGHPKVDLKVEDLKTEDKSETSEAASSVHAKALNKIDATELKDGQSHVGISEVAITNEKKLEPPDVSGKYSEADSTLNSDRESPKTDPTLKVDGRVMLSSLWTAASAPSTARTGELVEVTPASKAVASPTNLITSELLLKPETASDANSAFQKAEHISPKESTVVREVLSTAGDRTPKYLENTPASSGMCNKLTKSVAPARKSTPEVKNGNQVEERVNVSPHINEITQSAASQVTTAQPDGLKSKRQTKDVTLNTTNNMKNIYGSVKIGMDQLIVLVCSKEKRQQVYCKVCSVRLQSSDHLRETTHQFNYLKVTIPGWTTKPFEDAQKFQDAVTMLAKEQGNSSQRLEVMIEIYEELNRLPVKTALPRLKEMLRQKMLKGPSSHKKVVIGSPCRVTSSDDGVGVEKDCGLAKPEIISPGLTAPLSKTPAAPKETPVNSQRQPMKAPELEGTRKKPGHTRKTSDAMLSLEPLVELAVQTQSGSFSKDQVLKHQATPESTNSSEELSTISVGVSQGKSHGSVKPQVIFSGPTSTVLKTTTSEIPVGRQRQPKMVPQLQDARKTADAQKTSNEMFLSRDPHVEPPANMKESQSQSRAFSQKDQVKHHAVPERRNLSELSTISIAERIEGKSRLSTYLSLKKLDNEHIIGKGTVWECQGTSQTPFFLCESCNLMLRHNDICQHMISDEHKFNYVKKHHKELLDFWTLNDLTKEEKLDILNLIAQELAHREHVLNIDTKIVILGTKLYESLQNASFGEASKVVQKITTHRELRATLPPVSLPSQNSQQLQCPPTKMQSSWATEKLQKCENEVKQKQVKDSRMDREVLDIRKRKASRPLDGRSLPPKADALKTPLLQAVPCIHPKTTPTRLSVQKTVVSPISQHLSQSGSVSTTNRKHEHSKALSSPPGDREVSPTLPLPKPPSRKRSADTSVEALVRSCTTNSSENSLPTKSVAPPLRLFQQLSSEGAPASSITLDPAAPPPPPPPEIKNTKSIPDPQNAPQNYFTILSQVINRLRVGKKDAALPAPDGMKPVAHPASTSPPSDGKASLMSECIEGNTDKSLEIPGKIPQNNQAARGVVVTTTPTVSGGESSDPQRSQGSTGPLTCSGVATSVTQPDMSAACSINTIVTSRGVYGHTVTGSSTSSGPFEVSTGGHVDLSTVVTAPIPPAYAQYSNNAYGNGGHSVHTSQVNPVSHPTFPTPAKTVNSSINPHANSVVNPAVNATVNPYANPAGYPTVNPNFASAANPLTNSHFSSWSSCNSAVGPYPGHMYSGVNYIHFQTFGHTSAVGMQPALTNMEMQQYQYYQQLQSQQYLQQYYANQNQQQGWHRQYHS